MILIPRSTDFEFVATSPASRIPTTVRLGADEPEGPRGTYTQLPIIPLWAGPQELGFIEPLPTGEEIPTRTSEVPVLTQPDSNGFDIGALITGAITGFSSAFTAKSATQGLGGQIGDLAGQEFLKWLTRQQGEAVSTKIMGGTACWQPKSGKPNRRARVRVVRLADGTVGTELYCAKPRMNPLNPQALSRAARRLGRFQSIARGIDQMISRQICRKSRRASTSFGGRSGGYCGPRRRRCR